MSANPSELVRPTGPPTPLARPKGGGRASFALIPLLLAKGKLVFLLLTKLGLLGLSLVLYSMFWGWRFALLFIGLLAVHEAGHYVVMRAFGIDATLPSFIPGLGAMIFTRSLHTLSAVKQALVGLAGPLAGTAAAIACAAYGYAGNQPLFIAAAYSGFLLNAFNLLPAPPLDGSHVVKVVSDRLWAIGIVGFAALCWEVPSMRNPFVILIILLSVPTALRAWTSRKTAVHVPVPFSRRLGIISLYLVVVGVDIYGMLATHIQAS